MKSKKILNICLVLLMLLFMPVVHAHDITLAEEGTINIPDSLNAKTKIIIDEDITDYKMYYQWVEMPEDDYESYMEFLNLQINLENPGNNATIEEKEEYENTLLAYENSKIAVKPTYVESDWTESKDGTVPFNASTEEIEDNAPYVLWIKVVNEDDSENPLYEERLILYSSALTNDDIPNASTSDNIVVIGILSIAAVAFMMISYKKSRA